MDETPGTITDRPGTAMGAAARDSAKRSCIPEGTARAVLRDYARSPQKCRGAPKRRGGGRIAAPKGGTRGAGDPAADTGGPARAAGGSG